MPSPLPPTSRRSFLGGLALGGAALTFPGAAGRAFARHGGGGAPYLALLAGVRIEDDPSLAVRGTSSPSGSLRAAIADVLAQPRPPLAVVLAGDLRLRDGREAPYRRFLSLLRPLIDRGVPLHLALGNHDDRDDFLRMIAEPGSAGVGPRVVLLDSLDLVRAPSGSPDDAGRVLAKTLDDGTDASSVVVVHHNPAEDALATLKALSDAALLMEDLRSQGRMKALVFGHTHVWGRSEADGLHRIDPPAAAGRSDEPRPPGWRRLDLRRVDAGRSRHGERAELAWRGV